jgi:hypothetical protein
MESAAFPGRDPAQETLENDVTAHQALAWAPFLMTLFAIVITYSRLPVTDFYHVGVDGLAGGLGRALVHLNFPVSIAAIALIGIAVLRMRHSGLVATPRAKKRLTNIAAAGALLCLVTGVPGVVDNGDLDARPINAIPALGVLIALGLTFASFRAPGRYQPMPWTVRDRVGVGIVAVLFLFALPWMMADWGFYVGGIPLLDKIYMSRQIPADGALRAVHLGHHHSLDGYYFLIASLALGRIVRRDLTSRLASILRGYLGLMFSYGLLNMAEDFWLEQVVRRGWTDQELPDFLLPALSVGWALIIAGAIIAWALLFRPIESDRRPVAHRPRLAAGARSPA